MDGFMLLAVLGVLFVNGWTDAPNAIAAGVSTGAMTMRQGVWMATGMNLLGGVAALVLGQGVAETVGELGAFSADGAGSAALAAVLVAVIVWAVAAWVFGIPTSESHGLMAAVMGGAMALGAGGISPWAVGKVAVGLVFSVSLGFLGGWILSFWFRRMAERPQLWLWGQRWAAALMAFAHGLQDTPKFAALLFLNQPGRLPLWGMLLCSGIMSLGTLCGGGRIIRKVGSEMVDIRPREGFAADLAGTLSLLLSTFQGLPVSTTHAKTCALMGAATGGTEAMVDKRVVRELFLAWILTFPACGLLAFLLTKLFLLFSF